MIFPVKLSATLWPDLGSGLSAVLASPLLES
jgi:hypothetical protein